MSIRPIDMQVAIQAMNSNNSTHQQVQQAGANAHDNVARIQKDKVQNKETVKDPKDSRKIKSVKEDEDKEKQKNKQNKKKEDLTDEEKEELDKKEKEEKEKKKKNFVYRLGYNGKLELRPEDTEAASEGAGHIDLKA